MPAAGHRTGLVTRLMVAQLLVIGSGALTLVIAAALLAPRLFAEHLLRSGESSPMVTHHAEQAFASSFALSLGIAMLTALGAAAVVSWVLVHKVTRPIAELADAADAVAAGDYAVEVPTAGFGSELTRLSEAFSRLASTLGSSEATRTRMLADLAHELRTPLATLEAYIDGMEDGIVPFDAQSHDVMRHQVARLRRLAGDLKMAAAAEEHALHLTIASHDAHVLAADAVAAARPRFDAASVRLTLAPSPAHHLVRADVERVQQVLANLLDNALRHTGPGGDVRVDVAAHGSEAVAIAVTDDGDGLGSDEVEKVFQRFYRSDPSRAAHPGGGSGLGLTIARAIAESHSGTLTVTSAGVGTGSTFTLTLPRAEVRTSRTGSGSSPAQGRNRH